MGQRKLIASRYQIVDQERDLLGRGGMGDVYRVVDNKSGDTVAAKRLKASLIQNDPHVLERFAREGQALRLLNHPNIVKVLDTVEDGDDHYIIMEYVPGGSLREVLEAEPLLPIERVLSIGLELADALTRAHHLEIIHRDIKPANILLAEDGTPRLTDFGLAQIGDMARITQTGSFTGTYHYLSPEVYNGLKLDGRSDIWSFGVLLYEMLAGRQPFNDDQLPALITGILTRPVPDVTQFRPDVPEALANLVYQMLTKHRDDRIASVRLVGAKLEAILSGGKTGGRFETPSSERRPSQVMALGPRHNLPNLPTPFVGRAPEVAEVIDLLDNPICRLLTLVGPGGMGKTRLALEAARQRVDAFPHGVRFVPLAPVSDPAHVVSAIVEALKLSFFGEDDPRVQLLNFLKEKEMLLVLDNFEHVLDGADIVSTILRGAPGVMILATSREALSLSEEWIRPVRGMRYPDSMEDSNVDPYSAIKLFADRAQRYRANFSLKDELPAVIRICQLVEGMPLGIELAASWLKVLSPQQIAGEIERSLDFLASNVRNVEERHRSIRAVFDYSWDLLGDAEKVVFPRLAVFRGGFDLAAATEIADASMMTIIELVNKSLVQTVRRDGEEPGDQALAARRYDMHQLLQQYAAEKLKADGEQQGATAARHAEYYLQMLIDQEPIITGPRQKEAFDLLSEEAGNIRAAWVWHLEHLADDPHVAAHLAQAHKSAFLFYASRGLISDGERLFAKTAAAAAAQLEKQEENCRDLRLLQAMALNRHGNLNYNTNQRPQGAQRLQQSMNILQALLAEPDLPADMRRLVRWEISFNQSYLALAVLTVGKHAEALQMVEEGVQTAEEFGDRWLQAYVLNSQALIMMGSHSQGGIDKLRLSVALLREVGDKNELAMALHNLASFVGDPKLGLPFLEESLSIYRELNMSTGEALAYGALGASAFRTGHFGRARDYLNRALLLYRELGYMTRLPFLTEVLSRVAWAQGEIEEARQHLEAALQIHKDSGEPLRVIRSQNLLATFLLEAAGDHLEARRYYRSSLSLLKTIQEARLKAEALDNLGNLAIELGDYAAARNHFESNVPFFREVDDLAGEAWAQRNLGRIEHYLGNYEQARTYFEASLTLHQKLRANSWAVLTLWTDLGRLAVVQDDLVTASECFARALSFDLPFWESLSKLDTIVYVSGMLIRLGEHERALEYLAVVQGTPLYYTNSGSRAGRQKAARLTAHLNEILDPDTVAAVMARAATHDFRDVVAALQAMDALAPVPGD